MVEGNPVVVVEDLCINPVLLLIFDQEVGAVLDEYPVTAGELIFPFNTNSAIYTNRIIYCR